MRTTRAATWPRSLLALVGIFTLLLAVARPTWADHNADADDHQVECDAEFIDEEEGYWAEPGDTVTCWAYGLDPADEDSIAWEVEIFGWTLEDFDDDEPTVEESHGSGEEGVTLDEEGVLEFSFEISDEIFLGFFHGSVTQGDGGEGDLDYDEEFFGFIAPMFIEGDMACEPDPVRQGEQVECTAEEMTPDEGFEWEVYFFTLRELFDELLGEEPDEGDFEEMFEPDVEGEGVADGEGFGVYDFVVPTDREIDGYFTFVYQDAEEEYLAFYVGEVIPAEETEEEEHAEPTPVERPSRVETGAGGSTPGGGSALVVTLVALMAAGAAAGLRTTRG